MQINRIQFGRYKMGKSDRGFTSGNRTTVNAHQKNTTRKIQCNTQNTGNVNRNIQIDKCNSELQIEQMRFGNYTSENTSRGNPDR